MAVDSLVELKSVFDTWRRERKHIREPTPRALIARAMRAASVYGPTPVREATGISARHSLAAKRGGVRRAVQRAKRPKGEVAVIPAFSRIELGAPITWERPLVEVETPAGMKLRIFIASTDALSLVNVLCGKGGTP